MAAIKVRASTQQHLDIEDISEDLVVLKTGWVAMVLTTTSVNFDLLSEAEQDATIYAYGALLNSLSFPIQILIRTKKADITTYFKSLEEAERTQPNPDLKRQIQKYEDFIQATVQQKTVLDKEFYIIVDFSPLELGIRGIVGQGVTKAKSRAQLLADAKAALAPKRDHLIKQLARLGLVARQFSTQELIELFYDIYNPAPTGTQRVILDTASYTTPMVKPALAIPVPAPIGGGQAPLRPAEPGSEGQAGQAPSTRVESVSVPVGMGAKGTVNISPSSGLRPVPPREVTPLRSAEQSYGGQGSEKSEVRSQK